MIKYVAGDATDPQGPGEKLIVHVCNNIGAWGAGFVMALSAKWPQPEALYRDWTQGLVRTPFRLGNVTYTYVGDSIYVANMIAQRGVVNKDNPIPLDYTALTQCLADAGSVAFAGGMSVHMPRIGCGLAGGSWDRVESIINETMGDLSVTVYDLE